jgi:hypothetical protein
MSKVIYEVRKHFKGVDGYDYETLFKSEDEQACITFRNTLPKDNKKVQYTTKGYYTVKITEEDKREANRIHNAIWNNMTDDNMNSLL